MSSAGDASAGRRFFSALGPRCSNCHRHSGRGGRIGPDLTRIGRNTSRERVIASILQPSQEIAPRYQPWTLQTADGKTRAGLRLPRGGDSGEEFYADATGMEFTLRSDQIEYRAASDVSVMPAGLENALTSQELRDLVEFLMTGSPVE